VELTQANFEAMKYELEQERDAWKAAALYFADCAAATAQDAGMKKSGSKSEKNRFASIAATAAEIIAQPINHPKLYHYRGVSFACRTAETIIERCKSGVKMVEALLAGKPV
jgi:hypothetical protein